MKQYQEIPYSDLEKLPKPDKERILSAYQSSLAELPHKIVVLDDDPTGVQTVHGISVYTDWSLESFRDGFAQPQSMFFILTNSRSLSENRTQKVHQMIAERLHKVSQETGQPFIIISRSDSTLRGHYPLETQTIKETLEALGHASFDGEIICPYFAEGGRFTLDGVHYVREGEMLVPAGMTEFAQDKTFGYQASHLAEWCEEKTLGQYPAEDVIEIPLSLLRMGCTQEVTNILLSSRNFSKIIVNAADQFDIMALTAACCSAIQQGMNFIFRSAAAVPKALGGISERPLLTREELRGKDSKHGGLIVIGSHVNKTTLQLASLQESSSPLTFIEFNQHLVLDENGLSKEADRVIAMTEEAVKNGKTAVIYTRRDRLDLDTQDSEAQLRISVEISRALTSVVSGLCSRPAFIIAKGGITSSDIGTVALRVKRATVMGQVKPGIPVWMTGEESLFPHLPYIIFPGNVGETSTLREIAELLN